MSTKIVFYFLILSVLFSSAAMAMPQITSDVETEFGTYVPYKVNIVPSMLPYAIEPNLGNVANRGQFSFTDKEKALLARNGFVASPTQFKQVYDIYKYCQKAGIPIFVTTDSLLHVYHILYDYALRVLEMEELYSDLEKLNSTMLEHAVSQYEEATDPKAKTAAKKNVAYFSVASSLLDPTVSVPPLVKDLVSAELKLIDEHAGFSPSPIFGYEEDYSQYVPRGHYTRNEKLERYFRSMMWYGRMAFHLSPREGKEKGLEETLQAILIVSAIKDAGMLEVWDKIYEPTVFFVGKADDLNVYEYMEVTADTYGPNFGELSPDALADVGKLEKFIESARKLRSPMISSSWVWEGENIGEVTKGFRFMGQRFIPDSFMFQQLVHDAVAGRLLPKGLDIMAIMGSERAYDILTNLYREDGYPQYSTQIANLRKHFAEMDEVVWAQNLYWNWLYVLMPLLTPKGTGYPTFMQNTAWLDKDLATALGSWAELRHDTILYAKQSYTKVTSMPQQARMVKGYVEPNPELYARLSALARFTREGLSRRGLLLLEFASKFSQLEDLLLSLKDISELELTNQPLSQEQYGIIVNIGETLESLTTFPPEIAEEIEGQEDKEMAVIADVHTDPNSGRVLEVGVGYPLNIFVVVPGDGELRITQGAIFSYYEFPQPMDRRLTDSEWQKMLATDPPDLPVWMDTFIDLAESKKLGEHFNVEKGLGWQPTTIDVSVEPITADIGTPLEVRAIVQQGVLDSPPIAELKQADITIKREMKGEGDTYIAVLETKGLKPGTAQISVIGRSGEEDIVQNVDVILGRASAVESADGGSAWSNEKGALKDRIYLCYPNPFNPDVWIPYELSRGGIVTIEIYNTMGQLIRTLDLGYKPQGRYIDTNKAAYWDGRNSNGEQVSTGVYFYRFRARDFTAVGKMIAIK